MGREGVVVRGVLGRLVSNGMGGNVVEFCRCGRMIMPSGIVEKPALGGGAVGTTARKKPPSKSGKKDLHAHLVCISSLTLVPCINNNR